MRYLATSPTLSSVIRQNSDSTQKWVLLLPKYHISCLMEALAPNEPITHQERRYVYKYKKFAYTFGLKYEKTVLQFWWILDVMCTERVRRTNMNISKSNVDRLCVMMLVSPHHRHPHMICHQLTKREWGAWSITVFFCRFYHYQDCVYLKANNGDNDETPRFATSHLGLLCLYMFLFRMHVRTLSFRLATPLHVIRPYNRNVCILFLLYFFWISRLLMDNSLDTIQLASGATLFTIHMVNPWLFIMQLYPQFGTLMSRDMWFPPMWHFDRCILRWACAASFKLRNSKWCAISSLWVIE